MLQEFEFQLKYLVCLITDVACHAHMSDITPLP